jgi:methanethiol S-methyltransferase
MTCQNCILLAILWIAYCFVHSALISVTVTNFLKRTLRIQYRFFRIFYNIFSFLTLIFLILYSNSGAWKPEPLFTWKGMHAVQYGVVALGAILLFAAARHYKMLQFLGINQILQGKSGAGMAESGELDTTGVLGLIRHPWYSGVFLLLWASDITLRELVINLILSSYLVIGTFLEERKLVLEFGDRYREYQRQVSMFIPFKWLKTRLSMLTRGAHSSAGASPSRTKQTGL